MTAFVTFLTAVGALTVNCALLLGVLCLRDLCARRRAKRDQQHQRRRDMSFHPAGGRQRHLTVVPKDAA